MIPLRVSDKYLKDIMGKKKKLKLKIKCCWCFRQGNNALGVRHFQKRAPLDFCLGWALISAMPAQFLGALGYRCFLFGLAYQGEGCCV